MEHPFIHDISDKSLEDLQTTISTLMSKLNFAYRTGNGPIISQLNMALESYRNAYAKKMDAMIAKQNININIKVDKKT